MGYSISEATKDASDRTKALKKIKNKWPEAQLKAYDNIQIWVVDMDPKECNFLHICDNGKGVIIFKNIAPSVNIAPIKHYKLKISFEAEIIKFPTTHELFNTW